MIKETSRISAIFSNILFVIGVILLIIGFFIGTHTLVKSIAFTQYPLPSWEENRCDHEMLYQIEPYMPFAEEKEAEEIPLSLLLAEQKQEQKQQIDKCLISVEQQRKTKQVEDAVGAFVLLTAGSVLVFVFRKGILAA